MAFKGPQESGAQVVRPTGSTGRLYYNTTTDQLEVYTGTAWENISPIATDASGGAKTFLAGYTYHTFTSSGTFSVAEVAPGAVMDVLVVAGGAGGGGRGGTDGAGGGGAGGLVYTSSVSMSQPSLISSLLIVRGGVIRIARGSKSSQKRIKFRSLQRIITFVARSPVSIIAASINPLPRISEINGCCKCFRINFSF